MYKRQRLAGVLGVEEDAVSRLLLSLRDDYEAEDRGLVLLQLEDRWQLATKTAYAPYIKDIMDTRRNTPLSPAALEVLAIIAYNQPVSRSFIEQVRGVDSSSTVQTPVSYTHLFVADDEFDAIFPQVSLAHETLHGKTGPGSDFLGWVDLPVDYDKEEFARIKKAAAKIQSDSDVLVVIGIGGSYLGARAAIEALKGTLYNNTCKGTPQIFYVGNSISPAYLQSVLDACEGKDISVNVISKSGTTTEPALAFRIDVYKRQGWCRSSRIRRFPPPASSRCARRACSVRATRMILRAGSITGWSIRRKNALMPNSTRSGRMRIVWKPVWPAPRRCTPRQSGTSGAKATARCPSAAGGAAQAPAARLSGAISVRAVQCARCCSGCSPRCFLPSCGCWTAFGWAPGSKAGKISTPCRRCV